MLYYTLLIKMINRFFFFYILHVQSVKQVIFIRFMLLLILFSRKTSNFEVICEKHSKISDTLNIHK